MGKDEIRRYLASLGRKGGKKRAERLSKEQRSESARKAAQARWKAKKQRP